MAPGSRNPLSIAGYPVDPETLVPDFVRQEQKKKRQEERYGALVAEGQEVINELTDDRGLIVREAVKLYVDRINAMIAEDPQCQVFEKLFASIRLKIDAGSKLAESKAWSLLNKK